MPSRFRPRLTYANVMSTVAVFIALGGSSYAAVTLNGKNIKYRSVTGTKIKRNTLTKLEIRESRLGPVPKAKLADRLSPSAAAQLTDRCPSETVPAAGTCVETTLRPKAAYGGAVNICGDADATTAPARRLPTHNELLAAASQLAIAPDGELTSSVYPSSRVPAGIDVLVVLNRGGEVAVTANNVDGAKQFRCVVDPTNQQVEER